MNDQAVHAVVEAWVRWCLTRRFFIRPPSANLLARMQPAKIKQPPDARMSADLSWFNKAVYALVDMEDPDAEAFLYYYWERAGNIKKVAADMGVARSTFYVKVRRFARRAWSTSQSFKRAHDEMSVRAKQDKKGMDGPDT